jgi:hypothetical protein
VSNENIQSWGVYGVQSNASFCFEFLNKEENNAKKGVISLDLHGVCVCF